MDAGFAVETGVVSMIVRFGCMRILFYTVTGRKAHSLISVRCAMQLARGRGFGWEPPGEGGLFLDEVAVAVDVVLVQHLDLAPLQRLLCEWALPLLRQDRLEAGVSQSRKNDYNGSNNDVNSIYFRQPQNIIETDFNQVGGAISYIRVDSVQHAVAVKYATLASIASLFRQLARRGIGRRELAVPSTWRCP